MECLLEMVTEYFLVEFTDSLHGSLTFASVTDGQTFSIFGCIYITLHSPKVNIYMYKICAHNCSVATL